MKIGGEYTFDGPQSVVWDALLDPTVLASVLPGCEKLDLTGENEYEGALKLKVGPIQGQFMGRVRIEDIQKPDSYTMQVDGNGAPGFIKATGHLKLFGEGDRTRIEYEGDANVGGRLASVGQRLVETSARAIIKQSLEGLNTAIAVRAAAAAGPAGDTAVPPVPEFKAPTQSQFAASVAKEVARDLVPPGVLKVTLGVVAVVVIVLLYRLLT